eukprot:TRINITY_DN4879_c0_g1_i2.p1 TRINITY_DN4879_c0_g1~~TRINITY_DN4879_c0_g1_i2.p1  ORF type:complete len:560 (+),score=114.89 TRINITY_DN4879_c0_g1_i2:938-2617(+)
MDCAVAALGLSRRNRNFNRVYGDCHTLRDESTTSCSTQSPIMTPELTTQVSSELAEMTYRARALEFRNNELQANSEDVACEKRRLEHLVDSLRARVDTLERDQLEQPAREHATPVHAEVQTDEVLGEATGTRPAGKLRSTRATVRKRSASSKDRRTSNPSVPVGFDISADRSACVEANQALGTCGREARVDDAAPAQVSCAVAKAAATQSSGTSPPHSRELSLPTGSGLPAPSTTSAATVEGIFAPATAASKAPPPRQRRASAVDIANAYAAAAGAALEEEFGYDDTAAGAESGSSASGVARGPASAFAPQKRSAGGAGVQPREDPLAPVFRVDFGAFDFLSHDALRTPPPQASPARSPSPARSDESLGAAEEHLGMGRAAKGWPVEPLLGGGSADSAGGIRLGAVAGATFSLPAPAGTLGAAAAASSPAPAQLRRAGAPTSPPAVAPAVVAEAEDHSATGAMSSGSSVTDVEVSARAARGAASPVAGSRPTNLEYVRPLADPVVSGDSPSHHDFDPGNSESESIGDDQWVGRIGLVGRRAAGDAGTYKLGDRMIRVSG